MMSFTCKTLTRMTGAIFLFVVVTALMPEVLAAYGDFGYRMTQVPPYTFASMSYGPYFQRPYQFHNAYMPPMSLPLMTSTYGSQGQLSTPYLTPRASSMTSPSSNVLRALANFLPETQQTTYMAMPQSSYMQRPQPQMVYVPAFTQPRLHQPYSPSLYMSDRTLKRANLVQTVSSRPVQPATSYKSAVYGSRIPGQSGSTVTYLSGGQSRPATVTLQMPEAGTQMGLFGNSLKGLSSRARHPIKTLFVHEAECDWVGQFLRDPIDTCSYQVCSYASGGVKADGSIPLLPRRKTCPAGTAVPPRYTGGTSPPCSVLSYTCQGTSFTSARPSSSYSQGQATPAGSSHVKARSQAGPQLLRQMVQTLINHRQNNNNMLSLVGEKSVGSTGGCQKAGQFSRNPVDKCSYYVCTNGPTSVLLRTLGRCPPGSAVPTSFSGGVSTPCSQVDNTCGQSPAKPQVAPEVNRQLIKQLQTAFLGPQTPSVNYPATRYPLVSAPVNWGPLMSTVSGQTNPVVSYMPATSPGQNQQISSNMQTPTGSCQTSGQFLRDPTDRCRYLVCSAGMPTLEGSTTLAVTRAPCPPGTSVPPTFHLGYTVPCTTMDMSCTGAKDTIDIQGYKQQPQTPQVTVQTSALAHQTKKKAASSQSGHCETIGQHLRAPADKCSYMVCTAGPQTPTGNPTLAAQRSPCPPGTSVPPNYIGGGSTPCSLIDDSCSGM